VRGRDLTRELIGNISFTEYFWLLVTGALPTPAQRRVLDATRVAIAEHGLGPSVQASRMTLAAAPEAIGLPVEHVEDVTASPEMLGGRVKTLHPRVHAGIPARRDEADDVATLEGHGIEAFDLVCVNLYPFEEVTARQGVTEEEAVETIDVGGPSMLRGAAKNFAHCAPVCKPEQYHQVLEELRTSGELSLDTRRRLAAEAFAHTAAYEAAIANWFNAREEFPDSLVVSLEKVLDLAYGENPHQRAAYYAERGARRHLLSRVEQLHGKELSFNNLNDLSGARNLAREFALPVCVAVSSVSSADIYREGRDLAMLSDHIIVEVPLIEDALDPIHRLNAEGVTVCAAFVFSGAQALLAAKAGASMVRVALEDLDTHGLSGAGTVAEIKSILEAGSEECDVLVGSPATASQFSEAVMSGADIICLKPAVLRSLINHPLSDRGVDKFLSELSKRPRGRTPS